MNGRGQYGVALGQMQDQPLNPPQATGPVPPPENVRHASGLAQSATENFVGVVRDQSGDWNTVGFPSKEALEEWYAKIAYKKPSDYEYIAVFDKSSYGAAPYGSAWSPSAQRKRRVKSVLGYGLAIGALGALGYGAYRTFGKAR